MFFLLESRKTAGENKKPSSLHMHYLQKMQKMHLGPTVHNQLCQPKPSGDWPQERNTLRKESNKKKNQLNLCDFSLHAEQSPSPPPWGCTPQTHLLLLGNVPPHLPRAASITGEGHHHEEVPWRLAAGTGFLSQCFPFGSCTPCNAVWRYPVMG